MTSEPLPDELELEDLRITSPCPVSWDAMAGDDRVRHCQACDRQVFNLVAMSRREATELIRTRSRRLCVQLQRRPDGRVMTSDCPVGRRRRRTTRALALGGLVLALLAHGFARLRPSGGPAATPLSMPTLDDAKDWISHAFGSTRWCNCTRTGGYFLF